MIALNKTTATEKIIIQISDTHLMDHPDATFVEMNPEMSFHAVIEDILKHYPEIDAIVHTGDLAQVAKPETYARYQAFMQKLNIPFYQIPGNHDDIQYFPFETPDPMPTVLAFADWRMVLLNSAVSQKVDGWIKTEQLEHLKNILDANQQYSVVLACHHHPLEMKSNWIDRHKLKNTEELTEVLAKHNNIKAVIFGHVHQDSLNLWKNIQFLSTPSTSVQFKPLSFDFALDDIAPGYRSILLKDNGEFDTLVHRVQKYRQKFNKEISGY
ncbi:metallophosphatase [Acinetobacter sp. TGL-Y2]|uniref:3',5'-cyclic-AMP phosphodiesterase n=1 Tax=Acinetobacter sp. TGL-Y2 TaxID=1407071 RepID=UPI0007A67978|nr:3',5'-cyclic-AMP phosphodiesterase [Acinetobacter sp. TGL-Y2]AMW77629.1 metallophosphatase [Acinetobacter sp. TGL-Y2]